MHIPTSEDVKEIETETRGKGDPEDLDRQSDCDEQEHSTIILIRIYWNGSQIREFHIRQNHPLPNVEHWGVYPSPEGGHTQGCANNDATFFCDPMNPGWPGVGFLFDCHKPQQKITIDLTCE